MFMISAAVLSLLMAGALYILALLVRKNKELWRQLPREKIAGVVIAGIALVWAEMHAENMLQDFMNKGNISYVRFLVPVILGLSFYYLEYLFTRAVGGLIVLVAVSAMDNAFIDYMPARFILSTFCYAWGIYALFMIGMPWIFRDCLRKAAYSENFRKGAIAVTGSSFIVFVSYLLISIIR